jgi:hypothetical protein
VVQFYNIKKRRGKSVGGKYLGGKTTAGKSVGDRAKRRGKSCRGPRSQRLSAARASGEIRWMRHLVWASSKPKLKMRRVQGKISYRSNSHIPTLSYYKSQPDYHSYRCET